jgi:hypothetical protein
MGSGKESMELTMRPWLSLEDPTSNSRSVAGDWWSDLQTDPHREVPTNSEGR